MAKRENISVSFTPQQAEFLASCVASGRYQSTSEVVREAVRLLEDRQERRQAELMRLRTLIRRAPANLTGAKLWTARPSSVNGKRNWTLWKKPNAERPNEPGRSFHGGQA